MTRPITCMVPLAFLYQQNLIQRELRDALIAHPDIQLHVVRTGELSSPQHAEEIVGVLQKRHITVVCTVNDWGMDRDGILEDYMHRRRIVHINWCVDDPFYYEIMHDLHFRPLDNRIDFVSDRGYVHPLRTRGYHAFFCPLAVDPSLFAVEPREPCIRDSCFVGNSYRALIDGFVSSCNGYLESIHPLLRTLLDHYCKDLQIDLEHRVRQTLHAHAPTPYPVSFEKLVYIVKQFIGYLFRKHLVVSCAHAFPDFTVFGDALWVHDLAASRVSTAVGYYKNLRRTYQQTRVNIDINRVVIRDGFTQRVFDCLGAGAFIITSPKPVVYEYFHTRGPRQQIAVFREPEELISLIDYYRRHEHERSRIVQQGHEAVLRNHTYRHRVDTILQTCARIFGSS